MSVCCGFKQGLLDLDGSLVSILFHLVRTNNMYSLLDNSHTAKETTARYSACTKYNGSPFLYACH